MTILLSTTELLTMSKKRVPKTATHKNSKQNKRKGVPDKARELTQPVNYMKMNPAFRFASRDKHKYLLAHWTKEELEDLLSFFDKMEQRTWEQIIQAPGDKGLGYKHISSVSPPEHVSPDRKIHEARVCRTKRVFGYREDNVFNIIWFDRTHDIC